MDHDTVQHQQMMLNTIVISFTAFYFLRAGIGTTPPPLMLLLSILVK